MAVTITNLFGEQEELVVQTNNSKFILDKINNPLKAINEPTVKKLKSNKYTLQEKIEIVRQAVIEILGVYISNTRVIKTREELHEIIDIANKQKEIAIDTETNNSLDPITCKIMGLCLFVENQKNIYVPINHVNVDTKERLSWQLNEQDIKEELDRLNSDVKFIMHNGKFDYQVLKCTCNGKYLPYWDTLIAARLLDENEKAGLKEQYIDKIDPSIEKYSIEKLFGEIPYEYFDPELFALYAATDAFMTYKLYKYQQKEFAKVENAKLYNLFMEVEMPIVEVTAEMELRGTTIDREYSNLLGKKYELKMETLVRDITNELKKYEQDVLEWRKTPEANFRKKKEKKTKNGEYEKSKNEQLETPMNISSPIQLSIFLYDVLKCPSVDKKSPRGTGGEILETLKERRPDLSKLINLLLDYKTTEKLKGTFVDKLPTYINVDGRIHAGFNSMGTNCIKGSSIVLTSNGYYPIKELFNGNEIDGEYYEDSTKILNKDLQVEETSHRVKFSSAKTKTITLGGGYSITGTYHHPIICSSITREDIARNKNNRYKVGDNLDFKKLEDIEVGDIVAIPYGYNIFPQEYQELNCEVTKLVTHKREDIKFPKYCNEEFAELLGMYHADGSIHTSNGSYTIRIANHDKDVDNRVKYLVKNLFNIDTKYVIDSTYISATSIREISKFLTVGAGNKKIPSIIMQSPKSVICAYIRGMSLDSTYDKNRKRIKFTIANEESAYCVQSVLLNLGIISHLGKTLYKNEYDHMREKVDNHVGYRLDISGEYYDKYIEEIGVVQSRKLDRIPFKNKKKSYLVDNKYYYAYVKEIEDGVNDVFDFTIPRTHSFIANGIINHNTGRYSSKNPNLQQIPSHEQSIRMLFVPRPGYVMVGSDYSQQEPRILCQFSNDESMMEAYKNKRDLYAVIASQVYHNNYEDNLEHNPDGSFNPEGKARRTACKKLLLGIMYQMGANSLAEDINGTKEQAQQIIDNFYLGFPKVKQFIEGTKKNALKDGYVEDLVGRKRRLPDLLLPQYSFSKANQEFNPLLYTDSVLGSVDEKVKRQYLTKLNSCKWYKDKLKIIDDAKSKGIDIVNNDSAISRSERQCVNARIQGSAATMTKKAMIAVYNDKILNKLDFHLLIPVHDELIGECPIENAEEVSKRLSEIMVNTANEMVRTPMKCDAEVTSRWYEGEYLSTLKEDFEELIFNGVDKEDAYKELYIKYPESKIFNLKEKF